MSKQLICFGKAKIKTSIIVSANSPKVLEKVKQTSSIWV